MAGGEVVGDRVSGDVGERVLDGDVGTARADEDRELSLVVVAAGVVRWDPDVGAVAGECLGELGEEEGVLGDLLTELRGVGVEVLAQAHDLADRPRVHGGEQLRTRRLAFDEATVG